MINMSILGLALLPSALAFGAGESQVSRPIMVAYCQRTAQGPVIDGKLDDACWKDCQLLSDYVLDRADRLATQQTFVRICHDDRFLYMAFDCREDDMARTKAAATGWSVPWFEDSVEIFVDPTYTQQRYEQFGANLLGACNIRPPADSPKMTMARGSRDANGYFIELQIPLAAMRLDGPIEGKTVGLNMTRNRYRPNADEHSSWGRLQGSFHKPMEFGQLIFSPRPELQVQSVLALWKTAGLNVLEVALDNHSPVAVPVQLSAGDATVTANVPVGQSKIRSLLKLQPGLNRTAVTVQSAGQIVYKQELPIVSTPPTAPSGEVAGLGCFRILTDKGVYLQGDEVVASADAAMVDSPLSVPQITLTANIAGAEPQTVAGVQGLRFRIPQGADGKIGFHLVVADGKGGQLLEVSKDVPIRGIAKAQYEKQIETLDARINALKLPDGSQLAREIEYSRLKIVRLRQLTAGMTDVDLRHLEFQVPELTYSLDMLEQGKAPVWGLRNKNYVSEIDQSEQGYVVAVPSSYVAHDTARLPVFVFLHGFINDNPWRPEGKLDAMQLACLSKGVIAVSPYGRGSTFYRNDGEKDVWDVLEQVRRDYRVDDDRIYLGGFSMGGEGSRRLSTGRPHLLAASVICSIGVRTDQLSNLLNVPTWLFCGGQESCVSSMIAAKEVLLSQGTEARFTSDPNSGHTVDFIDFDQLVSWLLEHRVVRSPRQIRFVASQPNRSKAYWAAIDGFVDYGKSARMDIDVKGQRIEIQTRNVTALTLRPPATLLDFSKPIEVVLNGVSQSTRAGTDGVLKVACVMPTTGPSRTVLDDGPVKNADSLSGPMADVFTQPLLVVYGSGSDVEVNKAEAEGLAKGWNPWHHGTLKAVADTAVTNEMIQNHGFIIIGTPAKDSLMAQSVARLPVKLAGDRVQVAGKEYRGTNLGVCILGVNPLAPNRYVLWATGQNSQGVKLARQQVQAREQQDFVVVEKTDQDKAKVQAAGWFGADWQTPTTGQ